jgi:hypothetical protein
MKKPSFHQVCLVAGLLLVLVGVQLRVVESYVLSAEATAALAGWTGPAANSPGGMFEQIVVETTSPRRVVTPPRWLGWASLSAGVVLAAFALLGKWRK